MCSRSSSINPLKQTSINYRLDVWKGAAGKSHADRLATHISLDKLTSTLWCTDLWPMSGQLRSSLMPHSCIVWSYLITSFQQLSCSFLHPPLLFLYLISAWANTLSPEAFNDNQIYFPGLYLLLNSIVYNTHFTNTSHKNWQLWFGSCIVLNYIVLNKCDHDVVNKRSHSPRLTCLPMLILDCLETITLHSTVHIKWFTGLVHHCHCINNSSSLQTLLG